MFDCLRIKRSVDPLIAEWFGSVSGVRVPSLAPLKYVPAPARAENPKPKELESPALSVHRPETLASC